MTSWYGPLIDLSKASEHVGHFVQLLVFVHRSTPLQYKLSNGGQIIKTEIQVGDDTLPFFTVSLWKKEMRSLVLADFKITKFRDVFQARTDDWSSLRPLLHPYDSLLSKGAVELVAESRVGLSAKEKLRKVIEWVQRTGYTALNINDCQNRQLSRNWKVPEPNKFRDCPSLSEVLHLTSHCKAIFSASVGEIFLPITWRPIGESENENMFISRRLHTSRDNNLAEDLICTGCRLCGSPLDPEQGSSVGRTSLPLYCEKSSDRLHVVSLIYRPFMVVISLVISESELYIWDESEHMPLLVKNNAAEKMFGNIKAERVYLCYRDYKHDRNPNAAGTNPVSEKEESTAAEFWASASFIWRSACSLSQALIPIMISSIVPVVPKNTRGANDFRLIPTGIASKAPATEKTHVPNALQMFHIQLHSSEYI
ncbi:hypothetical protein CCACVL1_22724 [Corchorus capsularis]|uniref:Nucleic acid-binding protein n=1 Tax=Corchorus capsularis TaxID=210143 RepID=A0A1R3GX32_COCAP|nr:hypothetical protein CCACVL1_22724 [Corchorus capsularis]